MPVAAWHFPTMSLNADASGPRAGPQSSKKGRTTRAQPMLQVAGRPELQSSVDRPRGGISSTGRGRRSIRLASYRRARRSTPRPSPRYAPPDPSRRSTSCPPKPCSKTNAKCYVCFLPEGGWELPFRDREAGVVLPGAVVILPPRQGASGYSQRHRAEAGVVRLCSQRS